MADNYYKASDQILTVERSFKPRGQSWESTRAFMYIFDFEFKTMVFLTNTGSSHEQQSVHPFPALDAELLERMRDKLIELGGKPSPLTGDHVKPALPAPRQQKGLNP